MMNKILIILTGGTIGSQSSDGVLDTNNVSAPAVVKIYEKAYGKNTTFETIMPLVTLSENMNLQKIGVILKAVYENVDRDDLDGIIITHGSDTLSFTSNIAGTVFSNAKLPIVFVASNKELSDESGNGLVNFKNAVDFIKTSEESGVFVSWSNEKDDSTIFFSTDFCQADSFFDRFSSYDGRISGRIVDGKFIKENDNQKLNYDPEYVDLSLKKKALLIMPYPGLDYGSFDLSGYCAVVHYLYHSSTACVEGEGNSILNFIDKCESYGVDFFVAPCKSENKKIYSSLKQILNKKYVKILFDCSIENAYAKALVETNKFGSI